MKYSTLMLLLVFGLSCKKKDAASGPTTIQGQVVDASSGKGIYDATVGLVQQPKGSFGAAGMKQIAGVSSDRNGNFSFNFNYDDNYDYNVLATANYYYDSNGGLNIKAGTNKDVKVRLSAKGYVRFYLHNSSGVNTATVNITYLNQGLNISRDTSVVIASLGNHTEVFFWQINSNTGSIKDSANIFVKSLDTVSHTINY